MGRDQGGHRRWLPLVLLQLRIRADNKQKPPMSVEWMSAAPFILRDLLIRLQKVDRIKIAPKQVQFY